MIRDDPTLTDPQAREPHVIRSSATPGGIVEDDNVVDLLKQLAGQGSHLAEQQLALIKAEVRETANEMKAAVGAMAGAAVVGIAGLGVLLMGAAFVLGNAIENIGLATVLVGAATLALAYILYTTGAGKMRATNLSPDRTQRTLQRTPDAVRGDLQTENTR